MRSASSSAPRSSRSSAARSSSAWLRFRRAVTGLRTWPDLLCPRGRPRLSGARRGPTQPLRMGAPRHMSSDDDDRRRGRRRQGSGRGPAAGHHDATVAGRGRGPDPGARRRRQQAGHSAAAGIVSAPARRAGRCLGWRSPARSSGRRRAGREGDRVCALLGGGGYAEYAVCDARHALPIPAGSTSSTPRPAGNGVHRLRQRLRTWRAEGRRNPAGARRHLRNRRHGDPAGEGGRRAGDRHGAAAPTRPRGRASSARTSRSTPRRRTSRRSPAPPAARTSCSTWSPGPISRRTSRR